MDQDQPSAVQPSAAANSSDRSDARHRLRGFAVHMVAYFAVMIGAVVVNVSHMPGTLWFPFPMVVWGAPLALHAAYAMGLIVPYRHTVKRGTDEA